MSWNFETEQFLIRLPVSDQDGAAPVSYTHLRAHET